MKVTQQETILLERGTGWLHLRFKAGAEGATRLAHLDQHAPARALFPLAEPGMPPEAVLITTSGGLADGDRIDVTCEAEANTKVRVAAQAAEKIYRARGDIPARVAAPHGLAQRYQRLRRLQRLRRIDRSRRIYRSRRI